MYRRPAMTQRAYLTTPIYYVNDRPHIGHAYTTILADAGRRFQQLIGAETYFVTGTDEHGQKVEQAAQRRGISAIAHCDELHRSYKELWPKLYCAPDQFIRTTEPRHEAVVQRALHQLLAAGHLEAREFEGWYSTAAERFWTEKELVDGKCPDTGLPVVRLREKNWFFKMSAFQQPLIEAIESGRMEILPPHRKAEVLGFLRQPLQDLCISRPKERLRWGIELPFDPDFVTYVWVDALLNYVTAIGGLDAASPPEPYGQAPVSDGEGAPFATWWPEVTHLLGKDILTTHAVYWPTLLMALGLAPPRRLVAHGWWLMDDTKMSKSLGNVVDPLELADRYGVEALRWFLLREMTVGQDASFGEAALVRRTNADLANDIGNLVQRLVVLAARNFDGRVPTPPTDRTPSAAVQEALIFRDAILGDAPVDGPGGPGDAVPAAIDKWRLHVVLGHALTLARKCNAAIAADAPFKAVHTDRPAAALTVYHLLDCMRVVARLVEPALPDAALAMLRRIGWSAPLQDLADLRHTHLVPGSPVVEGPPLFPRIAPLGVPVRVSAHDVPTAPFDPARTGEFPPEGPAHAAAIDIDLFAQLDLRVGTVTSADRVPKSHKLLRLLVDLGEPSPRQILAGVAESLAPEDLLGQQVLVLANLPARKLMGLTSHGMLLVATDADGRRVPLQPPRPVPPGSCVA
ncbi:MAG: methionine--tRNA ligase [Myxococcales bacterium]|nr:methionine--tRNA ligase [Myxococcales bacterium]